MLQILIGPLQPFWPGLIVASTPEPTQSTRLSSGAGHWENILARDMKAGRRSLLENEPCRSECYLVGGSACFSTLGLHVELLILLAQDLG